MKRLTTKAGRLAHIDRGDGTALCHHWFELERPASSVSHQCYKCNRAADKRGMFYRKPIMKKWADDKGFTRHYGKEKFAALKLMRWNLGIGKR